MTLREAFESKMMLLDGGMGSVIQTYGIKGANNDMLSIEKPEIIPDIQRRYVGRCKRRKRGKLPESKREPAFIRWKHLQRGTHESRRLGDHRSQTPKAFGRSKGCNGVIQS